MVLCLFRICTLACLCHDIDDHRLLSPLISLIYPRVYFVEDTRIVIENSRVHCDALRV